MLEKLRFCNPRMGECIILKDLHRDTKLVCAINTNPLEFVIAHYLNLKDGSWRYSEYLGSDLDRSLLAYNKFIEREKRDWEVIKNERK